MPWKFKSIGVLGMAASLAAVFFVLALPRSESISFAQVVDQLRTAESLSYDSTITKVADGTVINKSRNAYVVPGKLRMESEGSKNGEGYVVFDIPAGQVLMVDVKQKTARISPLTGGKGNDMAAEMIRYVQSLKSKDSKRIGEKRIGDVQVKGFRFDQDRTTMTIWTNAATGALERIETVRNDFPGGAVKDVWTNIKLNEELDPELFSLKTPSGYKEQPFVPIDFNASPATFVAGYLKIYTKHMDGKFPAELPGIQALANKLRASDAASEDGAQLAFYGAAVHAVTNRSERGKDWQYFPNVTLGQRDKIVFWIRNRQSNGYPAVFGDLRVDVVNKDELPRAE